MQRLDTANNGGRNHNAKDSEPNQTLIWASLQKIHHFGGRVGVAKQNPESAAIEHDASPILNTQLLENSIGHSLGGNLLR